MSNLNYGGHPMPTTLKVTIQSVCNSNPQAGQMGGANEPSEIQWQATGSESYSLQLPGGVFVGYPNAFTLTITGTGWQPSTPLQIASNATAQSISNYIYQNGSNCDNPGGDNPPDIIIDS
jgi:hypothetical protein